MSEWVSVKEGLPEQDKLLCLVTDGLEITSAEFNRLSFKHYKKYWYIHLTSGYDWEWYFDDVEITHWMPIPELPE
jgi:hypothetical protein